jgi:hypothetical protein
LNLANINEDNFVSVGFQDYQMSVRGQDHLTASHWGIYGSDTALRKNPALAVMFRVLKQLKHQLTSKSVCCVIYLTIARAKIKNIASWPENKHYVYFITLHCSCIIRHIIRQHTVKRKVI